MTVLRVQDVGKAFRSYGSELHRFARWFGIPFKPREESWVVQHVNFEIRQGESIGIVGQNGAGKSTLLKLVTGTLQPTQGQVQVNGRIAAILELGMGFNPELTGRQNVYHSAGLMGFSVAQIREAMPAIEAFAEIGSYLDLPVRIYSSGMQVRVAFSVATAFRPDILIVDEALSVGDTYFQHKCMNRIQGFLAEGTSLLFVSHDPGAVKTLCDRAILLEAGQVVRDGDAASVMDFYQSLIVKKEHDSNQDHSYQVSARTKVASAESDRDGETLLLSEEVIQDVQLELFDEKGTPVSHLVTGALLRVNISVRFSQDVEDPHIGFGIRSKHGLTIYETNTYCLNRPVGRVAAGHKLTVSFLFQCDLGEGDYSFVVGVADGGYARGLFKNVLYFDQSMQVIKILATNNDIWSGFFNLKPSVEIAVVTDD